MAYGPRQANFRCHPDRKPELNLHHNAGEYIASLNRGKSPLSDG